MRGHNTPLGCYTDQGPYSMMANGCIVAWILPLRCFLFLLPNIFMSVIMMQYCQILTRGKYCNRNTPSPQYSPLLTSGG